MSGLANVGWHWRAQCANISVDGAPSLFQGEHVNAFWFLLVTQSASAVNQNMQITPGNFVLLSITYPAAAQFSVTIQSEVSFVGLFVECFCSTIPLSFAVVERPQRPAKNDVEAANGCVAQRFASEHGAAAQSIDIQLYGRRHERPCHVI